MTKDPDWVSPGEAAKILNVSRSTFYRLLERRALSGVRVYTPTERRPQFNRADREAWKAAREHDAGQLGEEKD